MRPTTEVCVSSCSRRVDRGGPCKSRSHMEAQSQQECSREIQATGKRRGEGLSHGCCPCCGCCCCCWWWCDVEHCQTRVCGSGSTSRTATQDRCVCRPSIGTSPCLQHRSQPFGQLHSPRVHQHLRHTLVHTCTPPHTPPHATHTHASAHTVQLQDRGTRAWGGWQGVRGPLRYGPQRGDTAQVCVCQHAAQPCWHVNLMHDRHTVLRWYTPGKTQARH